MSRRLVAAGAAALLLAVVAYEVRFGGRSSIVESVGIAIAGLLEVGLIGGVIWLTLRLALGPTRCPEPFLFMVCFVAVFVGLMTAIDIA